MSTDSRPSPAFPLISSKLSQRHYDESVATAAKSLVECSYAILNIGPELARCLDKMQGEMATTQASERTQFSFVSRTDGFMPSGMTFARDAEKVDLCETFNFWHCYKASHSRFDFSRSPLYTTAERAEAIFFEIARELIRVVSRKLEYAHPIDFRNDSFVQLNVYPDMLKHRRRAHLQELHEDGHLVTFIKPNAPGLLVRVEGRDHLVNLERDELLVISGSLLTELSDGIVQPLYHSVLDLNLPAPRASLIYNVNALYEQMPSVLGRSIAMKSLANQHHIEFGQEPYHSD